MIVCLDCLKKKAQLLLVVKSEFNRIGIDDLKSDKIDRKKHPCLQRVSNSIQIELYIQSHP